MSEESFRRQSDDRDPTSTDSGAEDDSFLSSADDNLMSLGRMRDTARTSCPTGTLDGRPFST